MCYTLNSNSDANIDKISAGSRYRAANSLPNSCPLSYKYFTNTLHIQYKYREYMVYTISLYKIQTTTQTSIRVSKYSAANSLLLAQSCEMSIYLHRANPSNQILPKKSG